MFPGYINRYSMILNSWDLGASTPLSPSKHLEVVTEAELNYSYSEAFYN